MSASPIVGSTAGPAPVPASGTARPPRPWETVKVVAGREISVKLHDKAFIGSTVFLLVVIALATVIPFLIQGQTPQLTVAVSGSAAEQAATAVASLGAEAQKNDSATVFGVGGLPGADVTARAVGSADEAERLVRSGAVSAAVVGDTLDGLRLIGKDSVPKELTSLLAAASGQLQVSAAAADAGLTSSQLTRLLQPTPPTTTLLEGKNLGPVPPQILVLVFAFLFYMSVLTFGISIAQSVVEEKQSRVVELLVAAVPVRWLLAGKVIGNTVLAVGQIVLLLGVGIGGSALAGHADIVRQILAGSGWFLVFFLLGFVLLACLWAVAGSLASRIEDLQSTTVVMQAFVMLPFFAALFATDPGVVQTALSYIPLTSPLLMPERVVLGNAAAWEPLVSAVLVLIFAVLSVGVGARLYEGSVLHTSSKLKVRQAWRGAQG